MSRINFLRFVVVFSIISVVALCSFSIFILTPSYTDLIIKNAENEAVKIGRHLAGPLLRQQTSISRKLPADFIQMSRNAIKDLRLEKIKVYSPEGETVYSTDPEDVGKFNERDYFINVVAKGGVYTKFIEKNSKTLEGRTTHTDVVESYVPLMHENTFAGAFELYLDVSATKHDLDGLLFYSNSLLLLIAAVLILAVLTISLIARRSFNRYETAEKKIIQQSYDLEESRAELEAIIENSATGITLSDLNGKILRTNPAHQKIFGYGQDELSTMAFSDFTYPDDIGKHQTSYEKLISGDIESFSMKKRFVHKDGHLVWAKVTVSLIRDADHKPMLVIGMLEDITEGKLAEEEREKLIAELEKALSEIKTLQGIIPICMYCKKIKSDKDVWDQLETYLEEHSDADFSHGICPDCYEKQMEEFKKEFKSNSDNSAEKPEE